MGGPALEPGRKYKGAKVGSSECYETGRYLTFTGRHFAGTPTVINQRQDAISAVYEAIIAGPKRKRNTAKKPITSNNGTTNTASLELDDTALLAQARKAANGAKFSTLYDRGDWNGQGFPSQSEADLGLCPMLAFWTRRDPGRIDRLFRASGLMRDDKWNREDYRRHDQPCGRLFRSLRPGGGYRRERVFCRPSRRHNRARR